MQFRFHDVRVPRENLLDRFATVDRSGQYRSPYSASRRFAATLGELTGGRIGLTGSSLAVLKVRACCALLPACCATCIRCEGSVCAHKLGRMERVLAVAVQGAVTIAVRYGAARQQFGPPDAPEISVLDYTSQQEKLMPMLATAYALHFTTRYLVAQYMEAKRTKEEEIIADVHALSAGAHRHACRARPGPCDIAPCRRHTWLPAQEERNRQHTPAAGTFCCLMKAGSTRAGLKAYATGFTANALSVCRECCGGHGYAAVNRFGAWRSDHDIFQTFEGDNTVLLQQVCVCACQALPWSTLLYNVLVLTGGVNCLHAQVAGLLLKKYKERFATAPVAATYRYLRQWAADSLPANPLVWPWRLCLCLGARGTRSCSDRRG